MKRLRNALSLTLALALALSLSLTSAFAADYTTLDPNQFKSNIGDTVNYTIVATIDPNMAQYDPATYTYIITDTLSEGVVYDLIPSNDVLEKFTAENKEQVETMMGLTIKLDNDGDGELEARLLIGAQTQIFSPFLFEQVVEEADGEIPEPDGERHEKRSVRAARKDRRRENGGGDKGEPAHRRRSLLLPVRLHIAEDVLSRSRAPQQGYGGGAQEQGTKKGGERRKDRCLHLIFSKDP